MPDLPHTSHVSLTDARRNLLATVADYLDRHPHPHQLDALVAADAIAAFRDIVNMHDVQKANAAARRRANALKDAARIREEIDSEDIREKWSLQ
jgi:hypothetical protein